MGTDYDHYLGGCREKGLQPISSWRFRVAFAWYQRESHKPFADILALGLKQRARFVARLDRYKTLMELAFPGRGTSGASGPHEDNKREDDKPGTESSGDREPRVPLEPMLTGCAARPLPIPDAPDQSFWRV